MPTLVKAIWEANQLVADKKGVVAAGEARGETVLDNGDLRGAREVGGPYLGEEVVASEGMVAVRCPEARIGVVIDGAKADVLTVERGCGLILSLGECSFLGTLHRIS